MGELFSLDFMLGLFPQVIVALPKTLMIAGISALIGLMIGLLVALVRYLNIKGLTLISKVYVSFIRGTPALVQLMLVYYGLPIVIKIINLQFKTAIALDLPKDVFAILALSLNAGAYMSETFRSALQAVDVGQLEASYSLNMTTAQALRRIIVPQAFAVAIPPLANTLTSLIKETSLLFTISVVDLMAQGRIIASRSYRYLEMYVVVSIIYWVVCTILAKGFNRLEKKFRKYERGFQHD